MELSEREGQGCAVAAVMFLVPFIIDSVLMVALRDTGSSSAKAMMLVPWPVCVIGGLVMAHKFNLLAPHDPQAKLVQHQGNTAKQASHAGNDPNTETLTQITDAADVERFVVGQLYRGRSPAATADTLMEHGFTSDQATTLIRQFQTQLPFSRVRDGVETASSYCDLCFKEGAQGTGEIISWRKEVGRSQPAIGLGKISYQDVAGRYFLCGPCRNRIRPEFGSCLKSTIIFAILGAIIGSVVVKGSLVSTVGCAIGVAMLGSCWIATQPGGYRGSPVKEGFKIHQTSWDEQRGTSVFLKFLAFYSVLIGLAYFASKKGFL